MEHHHDRNQQYYRQAVYSGQNQTAHVSATYDSSSSLTAARFKMPQLPQTTLGSPTRPLAHASYLAPEQFTPSAFNGGFQYPGRTSSLDSLYHHGYDMHQQQQQQQQQPISPSYGPSGYMYGYQQAQHNPIAHQSHSDSMRSMSVSSFQYDVSSSPHVYPSATASYTDLSSPIVGPDMYESMSMDHHGFQSPATVLAAKANHSGYSSYKQARQQFTMEESQNELRETFEQYQTQTKEIFTHVKECQLKPAADLLLQISRYLIGNVEALGLDRDDRSQHAERLELWDRFNQCWLTALQMQFKMTQLMARTGQQPPPGQSVLDHDALESMGQELVHLCDGIEKVGLVDYQMGVAEEQIIELLLKCLDILKPRSQKSLRASGSSIANTGRGH